MPRKPPRSRLREIPLLVFVLCIACSSPPPNLPAYTQLPLPSALRLNVSESAPGTPRELHRARAEVVRVLHREPSAPSLAWAMQLDLALGRPADAIALVERFDHLAADELCSYLSALSRFERARLGGDPWRDDQDLQDCVRVLDRDWRDSEIAASAAVMLQLAELSLGRPERAADAPQPHELVRRRLRDSRELEREGWLAALERSGGDADELRRLFELRPALYCFDALQGTLFAGLLAVERGDQAGADSLAALWRSRADVVEDHPELLDCGEDLLSRWVDERPTQTEALRDARELLGLLGSVGSDSLEAEVEERLLPGLRAAGLDLFEVQFRWVQTEKHYRTDPVRALETAGLMVDAAERSRDLYSKFMALDELRVVYNNLPDARRELQTSQAQSALPGIPPFDVRRQNRARFLAATRVRDWERARRAVDRQLARALRLADRDARFEAFVDRAYLDLLLADPASAIRRCGTAHELYENFPAELRDDDDVLIALQLAELVRGQALSAMGQPEEALAAFESSQEMLPDSGGRQPLLAMLLQQSLHVEHRQWDAAEECLQRAAARNDRLGYRDFAWRLPHAMARQACAEGDSVGALRLYREAWERRWSYGLELGGQDLASHFLGGTRELADEFFALSLALRRSDEELLQIDRDERALLWGSDEVARPSLRDDEAVLQFRVTPVATELFLVRGETVFRRSLPMTRGDWSNVRRDAARALLEGRDLDATVGQLLGTALLAHFEDLLETPVMTLRVAPAGEMAALPWSLLGKGGHRLCESQQLLVSPFGGTLSTRADRSAAGALIVAYSGDGESFLLPGVERHARSLSDRWPEAELLCGDSAGLGALLQRLPAIDRLVLAGHAGVDPDGSPFLRLAGDRDGSSTLVASDLRSLDLSALRTVLLIGCGTALEADQGGSAPGYGLAGAFLGAGARRVVASIVPIADRWDWSAFAEEIVDASESPSLHCLPDPRFVCLTE